jgi:hypothetical protein
MEKHAPSEKATVKSCAKCGTAFECLHNADCWCMNITLTQENLNFLKENFADCLCPSCLDSFAEKHDK